MAMREEGEAEEAVGRDMSSAHDRAIGKWKRADRASLPSRP